MLFNELGDFVESLTAGDNRQRSFGGPSRLDQLDLAFHFDAGPVSATEFGLILVDADDPDVAVTVAFADVLHVTLGTGEIITDHLERLHLADEAHADLPMMPDYWPDAFSLDELATGPAGLPIAQVLGVAPETIGSVLMVRDLFVDEAFRGRRLGMLLASSVMGLAYVNEDVPSPTLILGVPRFGRYAMERGDTDLLAAACDYWASGLGLSDLGDGIYGVVTNSLDIIQANDSMSRGLHDLDAGYIKVDVAALRERRSVGDPTLWPRSRGLLPRLCLGHHDPDASAEDDDLAAKFEGSLDRMARVIASIAEGDFPAATAEVATIVRFYAGDQATAFDDAAAYLREHPDFEVRSVAVYFDEDEMSYCLALTVLVTY